MGYLVLYLNNAPDDTNDLPIPSAWLVDQKTGSITNIPADLAQLQAQSVTHQLLVIVPSEDVLLMPYQLPAMSKQRLKQALPFALEEQLIADVDSLHFALPTDLNRQTVAIVSRASMDKWMMQLRKWELKPRAMIPLLALIPAHEAHLTCVLYGDKAAVRINAAPGFTCDAINLSTFLQSIALQTEQKILIHDYAGQAIHLDTEIVYEVLNHQQKEWQADLLKKAILPGEINLLQGDYQVKQSLQNNQLSKYIWKYAVIFLTFLIGYPLLTFLFLQSHLSMTNHKIAQLTRQYFPHQVISSHILHEKFTELAGQDAEIFNFLKNIALALSHAHIEILQLQYQAHQMTLQVRATTSDQLAAFVEQLQLHDSQARQDNVDVAGDKVTATIIL